LLTDLYAPNRITHRDDNIDRVFPKMVKWLPDHQLRTLARLVELNLLTQQLDHNLAHALQSHRMSAKVMAEEDYCLAYRYANDQPQRLRQIELIADVGHRLDRYVRNRTLGWLLSMGRGPAEMANLQDLHSFLHRGYSAFRCMDEVGTLIDRLVMREQHIMNNILSGQAQPFELPASL
jgi:N-acyl-D-aspartate/D-glutamate deacylase